MDLLNIQSHFQESARRAAGSFLSPLTNAIGEQRRLVESLAVVSKIRVEECKHMMVWSKSQTDDLGDVLLKLNLLIRKISDYEIRFGTQYESFREKIKYLRTKDDSLCEMGRRQADLQQKILDASKSRLRTAKAKLLQTELDAIQKESAPTETKLQRLKRQVIKGAYTEQLDAIMELGKKMQIIGEHGKQLLEHIDLPLEPGMHDDGRKTEDILQAARIALENWDQLVMVNPQSIVVHPPPARSHTDISIESIPTLAVSEAPTNSDSDSDSDSSSEQEFVQAPSSPLKAKASVALTTTQGVSLPEEPKEAENNVNTHAEAETETEIEAPAQTETESEKEQDVEAETSEVVTAAAVVKVQDEVESESETEDSDQEEEPLERKHGALLTSFGSTLAPKLTLSPSKPQSLVSTPPVPKRSSDWASEATEALASVQIKKVNDIMKHDDTSASEAETLKRLEELEIKQAMELSLALAETHATAQVETSSELKLTAEELRFVMGDVAPKRSTKVIRRQARAPETMDGGSAPISVRPRSRMSRRKRNPEVIADTVTTSSDVSHTDTESEQDMETPETPEPVRVVRGPQATEPEGNRVSQQGPRPWVPEEESAGSSVESEAPEELASSSHVGETMGEDPPVKSTKNTNSSHIMETMGPEPEKPLESMGPEPEKPLESMGPEPEVTLESMGHDGPEEDPVPFVPMPKMPSLDGIREQKIMMKQQQQQQQQQQQHLQQQQQQLQGAYGVSPELQYLQLQNSPQNMHQQIHGSPQPSHGSVHTASPSQSYAQLGNYQSPGPYRPSTTYVPQTPKQKNRLSGSHTPPHQGTPSPGSSPQPQYQQQFQSNTYSAQYLQQQRQHDQQHRMQQQQQLQDFYYSPYEQEYQQQAYQQYQQQLREQHQQQRVDSVSSISSAGSNVGIAPLGWNLPGMAPPQIMNQDVRYYQQQQQQQQQHLQHAQERPGSAASSVHGDDHATLAAPSPSPSHTSLALDNTPSPALASVAPLQPQAKQPDTKASPHTPSPDDYKVEVK